MFALPKFAARLFAPPPPTQPPPPAGIPQAAPFSAALKQPPGFVLLEVRGPEAYARGHVPGALNLPHRAVTEEALAAWPRDALFVVYCAGPHCNGADRAALRLARLGRRVKTMPGGMAGWVAEGFPVATGGAPGSLAG